MEHLILATTLALVLTTHILLLKRYMREWDDYARFIEGFTVLVTLILGAMLAAALTASIAAAH